MNSLHRYLDADIPIQLGNTPAKASDQKSRLVREIGRLRIQLHQAQLMDKTQQRSEFLRCEIATLKGQIERLGVRPWTD